MADSRPQYIEFDTIDSTNSEAHRRAAAGERGPLWIRAERQENGRGRSGRNWASPPGNLALSLLFAPGCLQGHLYQLSFVAALWVFDALSPHVCGPERLQLKWPNDLLIGPAKVGGILVESSTYDGTAVAIVGSGVNIASAPPVEDRLVTHLAAHGNAPTPRDLVPAIQDNATRWLEVWRGGSGFAEIRKAWLERSIPLGETIAVNGAGGRQDGRFAGLADDGALLMQPATGDMRRISFGDVSLVGGTRVEVRA